MYKMLGLRYFTMLCNNAEYKKMGQDLSLGQLYDVHNEKRSIPSTGWAYSFITTLYWLFRAIQHKVGSVLFVTSPKVAEVSKTTVVAKRPVC